MKEKKKSSFAVLEMVFYIAALMCSHKAAFGVQANMRVSLRRLKRRWFWFVYYFAEMFPLSDFLIRPAVRAFFRV